MDKGKMAVGEAVIEFYASLDIIRDYYENRGYRKITLLHKLLKEQLNWKMGYDTFRYHFNKEFKNKKLISDTTTIKEESLPSTKTESEDKKHHNEDNVIIATPIFPKAKKFIPYGEDE